MVVRRRSTNTYSLAFLDIMSCGLGATVLLFLIIRHNIDPINQVPTDLSAETNLLQEEILVGQENLVRIRNTLSLVDDELATAMGLAAIIQDEIEDLNRQIEQLDPNNLESLDQLRQRISEMETQRDLLRQVGGEQVRQFVGEGQRQYLTGINMGGRRNLILLDSSASMLDTTIVNILRRRNMDEASQLQSAKWQQGVKIAEWLLANLPVDSQFQIYAFGESVSAVVPQTQGNWLLSSAADSGRAVENLHQLVPQGASNLFAALGTVSQLNPRPDNIFLITDGLPTLGEKASSSATVSANERLQLFNQAVDLLPLGIPVNTMLLPLEGDYYAAMAYWSLAIDSKGSFLTPTKDWP